MAIINYQQLNDIRDKYIDKKIGVCSGTFDITHAGHILFFEDCKKYSDILVVIVARDSLIKGYKGNKRPILNEFIRLKTVDSLKPVDYTILDQNDKWNDNIYSDTMIPIFEKLKPDFFIINGESIGLDIRKKICDQYNIKFVQLERWCPKEFEGISTTKIIQKID